MLQTGWAMVDVTPKRPALLQGQMHTRIASEARDPLTFTAMAVRDTSSKETAILISGDMAMFSEELVKITRERIIRHLPEIKPESIMMFATHTHDSLVIESIWYPHPGGDVMTAEECFEWLVDKGAEVAIAAWRNLTPTATASALGQAMVAHNRRPVYAHGEAIMYGATNRPDFREIEGPSNHYLDMLFAWDPSGKLIGLILSVPCPSQAEENLNQFSADFWHETRMELRQRLGSNLQILALCGAGGDQSPHMILAGRAEAEMRRRRGLTERQEIARRITNEVVSALECTTPIKAEDGQFSHACKNFNATPRTITRQEHDWAVTEAEASAKTNGTDNWWTKLLRQVADDFEGKAKIPPMPVEVHALRFGELAITTSPFELFVDYAFQIIGRSPAQQTAVVQLACGIGLYLPTPRGATHGSYGAMPAVAPIGPEGGQEVVEASLELVSQLFPQR